MLRLLKVFSFFGSVFLLFFLLHAQDLSGYQLGGGEEDQTNFFLQQAIQQDDTLKTKAQIFNGSKSGVYEGQKLSCPYAFERDLFVGVKGEDVRLLQILLNSDKRTLISISGPGSLGQESDTFGESTKEAVKKFQALFIEYVGIANGRFGPRTRTVMNAICNGENTPTNSPSLEARQNRNIYENIFMVQNGAAPGGIATVVGGQSGDTVPPRVSLSANVSSVKAGETFKVILTASEEIVPITPESLIVDGGSVKEIRKLSKVSYTSTINVDPESKKVLVQVEADKVEDLAGNKNENASNEISVKVVPADKAAGDNLAKEGDVNINSLLDKIISAAPQCSYNGSGILITVGPDGRQLNTSGCAQTQTNANSQTYNCNGQQIPVTQPCQQQTQTVCSFQTNPYTGMPQQVCQQMTPQQAQAQQQAQQKAMENQQIGQLLGSLLKNQNGQSGLGPFGGGGGGGGGPFGNGVDPSGAAKGVADLMKQATKDGIITTTQDFHKCSKDTYTKSACGSFTVTKEKQDCEAKLGYDSKNNIAITAAGYPNDNHFLEGTIAQLDNSNEGVNNADCSFFSIRKKGNYVFHDNDSELDKYKPSGEKIKQALNEASAVNKIAVSKMCYDSTGLDVMKMHSITRNSYVLLYPTSRMSGGTKALQTFVDTNNKENQSKEATVSCGMWEKGQIASTYDEIRCYKTLPDCFNDKLSNEKIRDDLPVVLLKPGAGGAVTKTTAPKK